MELLVWVHTLLLASVRLTVGLALTPLFGAFRMPALARLVVVVALAGLAASSVRPAAAASLAAGLEQGGGALMLAAAREAGIGLLIALGIHAAFGVFTVAGRLLDVQMGFNLGSQLDPVSKTHAAVLASGFNFLAVTLFVVTDAHQALLAGFFRTFDVLPIGQPLLLDGWVPYAQGMGAMFSLGFALASPVIVALLLADVVVAVLSRNLPQMNVLFLSIPLKVLLGLMVAAVSLRLMAPVMEKALALPLTLLDRAY